MAKTTKEWMHVLNNEPGPHGRIEPFGARAQFARALSIEEKEGQTTSAALVALDKAIEAQA